jgi:hypothetical protein
MKLPRRNFLHLAAGTALPAVSSIARAQAYPSRPVRLIVPVKRNNGVSERRTNRVVAAGGGAERPERHLERDAHETDRFAVERLTL